MITTFVRMKHTAALFGLVSAMLVAGTAPLLDGYAADADAKPDKHGGTAASAEQRGRARRVQRFDNTEVRLGFIDGVGTVATSSSIEVSGLVGPITDVNVNLIDITHRPNNSEDMDVLLIGPEGRTALILSDVAAGTSTSGVSLVLDDQQEDQLPNNSALTNGFFQPTNIGSPDPMPLGGGTVTPPSGASLGVFNGINPNGTWQLFAYDDEANGSPVAGGGINGGWALTITTANGVPKAAPDRFQNNAGKTLRVNAAGVLENDIDPDNDLLTAALVARPKKGKVTLAADGSFTYKSTRQAKGKDRFTYMAKDPTGLSAQATVEIQIKAQKQKKNTGG